jgi:hypothetical protein
MEIPRIPSCVVHKGCETRADVITYFPGAMDYSTGISMATTTTRSPFCKRKGHGRGLQDEIDENQLYWYIRERHRRILEEVREGL